MKTIKLSDRVEIRQISSKVWLIVVDGSVVFRTHNGERGARCNGLMWVDRTSGK